MPSLTGTPPLLSVQPRDGTLTCVDTCLIDEFQNHRAAVFALAYRMLGSAQEAEDTVQDCFLRWTAAEPGRIERPRAWLLKVATNLCLNRLTSARATREEYLGPWLPEPVLTGEGAGDPAVLAELREEVSYALLVLLERLTPSERAVYVLREAFAYSHREVAEALGTTEANSRQLHRRAVGHLGRGEHRFDAGHRTAELVDRFLAAARDGDLPGLEALLARDAVWWSDGGGKVSSARRPVEGRAQIVRLLAGLLGNFSEGVAYERSEVNGEWGVVVTRHGELSAVVLPQLEDELITGVRVVMNPDKLVYAGLQSGGS